MVKLEDITANIGNYTTDSILITEAEPFGHPGPRIVWCNRAFTEMTGYTLEEILGRTPRLLQGPDTDPETLRAIRDGMTRWENIRVEVKNYTKAGDPYWSDLSITPVADASGWFHYWVAVERNITRKKEEELTLQERLRTLAAAQQRLMRERAEIEGIASVPEQVHDLITITDVNFCIEWANKAFMDQTGYELSDIIGRSHCDLLAKRSGKYSSREAAIKAVLHGQLKAEETQNVTVSGRVFWTDTRVSVQRDSNGRPLRYVIVERDITEQRQLREELRAHRDNLQDLVEERTRIIQKQSNELSRALDAQRNLNEQQIQFVRMASHEFRTPMSVISMAARRLRKTIGKATPEEIGERLDIIDQSINRLGKLIDSTLSLAKADAGKLEFKPRRFDFLAYFEDKLEVYRDLSPKHRIDFQRHAEGSLIVNGDANLFEHIFDNLFHNAQKYSPNANTIEIVLTRDADSLRVDVRDFGVGIPAAEIPKLYQRYFRASTAMGIVGTGIGLSVVKEFVDLHGGKLIVESTQGVGSTFSVVLPLAEDAQKLDVAS